MRSCRSRLLPCEQSRPLSRVHPVAVPARGDSLANAVWRARGLYAQCWNRVDGGTDFSVCKLKYTPRRRLHPLAVGGQKNGLNCRGLLSRLFSRYAIICYSIDEVNDMLKTAAKDSRLNIFWSFQLLYLAGWPKFGTFSGGIAGTAQDKYGAWQLLDKERDNSYSAPVGHQYEQFYIVGGNESPAKNLPTNCATP